MRTSCAAPTYRADIDGLRAIAVLSVMVFHAHDAALPGGFVGVDIFFVISGYLISRHIAEETASQRFSLLEFYRRRIRRIMPMMMTVVAATLLASLFILTPDETRAVAKSAVWALASMANIHFWRELDSGYFASSSAELPLLHLWSLGVEEQFYLLWPVLLSLGVRKLRPAMLLFGIAVLAVLSFELASRVFPVDASFAYYMLPTRMGALLLGALAGVAGACMPWQLGPGAARMVGWLGAALVAASLWAIDRHAPFPGWLALPPALGAAFLILAGEPRAHPVSVLASAPLVFVGKISYSAYLWHWPLFALYRYGYGEPGIPACAALLVTTLLLAWLSFVWIERPTRSSSASFSTIALRQFAVPAVVLLVPSLLVIYAGRIGLPLAPSDYLVQLERVRETTRPAFTFDWVCQRQRLAASDLRDPRCVLGAPGLDAPRAILWGDSNAAHYIPMVQAFATRAGVRFRNVAVGSCPPLFADPRPYVEARRVSDCLASAAVIRGQLEKYPVVLISAAWSTYLARSSGFIDDVQRVVRSLTERGQTVVLIGRAPILPAYDRHCQEKALRVPFKTCPHQAVPLADEVTQVNALLRQLAGRMPGVYYFDVNRYLCPGGTCPQQTASGEPRFIDASHLTVSASAELGRAVLAAEGIPSAFAALGYKP
ncbi:MAG: acyltransferase family protein [Pseudomonadota bacterium]